MVSPTTFGDELDGDTTSITALIASPGGNGISLREAVVAANNTAGDDTINLSAGTYTLSLAGANEDASLTGDLDITESVQIDGDVGGTIIDATGMFDRIFDVANGPITVGLKDIAVTGGLLPANASPAERNGGAMRTDFQNQITIEDSSFYGNRSTIDPPTGEYSRGGALLLRGDVTIERTSFTNNHATNDGGAILSEGTGTDITIVDSSFSGNSAPNGGAIYTNVDMTIHSSLFNGNTTAWDYGGGGNAGSGGAIEVQGGALFTANNITVSGNVSGSGGGIALWSSTANIFSSTIVNNQGTDGGGIYVSDVFTPSVLNIKDSIISLNTATNVGPNVWGEVLSGRNNLVGSTSGVTGFGAGDTFVLDPRIGPLADNSGPVHTHELLLGSAAIDAGSDDPLATDARGTARPFRAKGDIGAFESTAPLNQSPDAMDDSESIDEDEVFTINILTNDADPEGYPLTVILVSSPTKGLATVNADQTITYTPDEHKSGTDTLEYQISDGFGGTDTATVQITIAPINDAPVATNDPFTLTDSSSVQLDVLGNDMDVDSVGFSIDTFTQPAGGVVSVDGSGVLSYQPNVGFEGIDFFTYNLVDTEGLTSDFATVTVEVVLFPSVSGSLFDDVDGDGVQTAGEDPMSGVTVFADFDGDGVRDPSEPFNVTASDGTFTLFDLPVGDTLIRVEGGLGQAMTGSAEPIPRLFVSDSQSMLELNVISGIVIDSFSLATLPTAGAEPSGIAFDGSFVYVYDGIVNDILVFDPDMGGSASRHVDTIDLNVQNNQNYVGLAVIGTTLFALEQNADVILTIDLTTGSPGPVLDIPDANTVAGGNFPYDLWAGLGESADGTKLIVSTTGSQRLELDPLSGVITGVKNGINGNDVPKGLAGASGRVFAGRASAHNISIYDESDEYLRFLPVSLFVNDIAAGPSRDVGTLLNLQSDQDVTGLVFGLTTSEGSITGTQFVDANADGVMDPGELPLAGATVFVDLNNNGWPDPEEPQAISGSDGTYTLTGVPAGSHYIRSILPSGYAPSAAYTANDRLFAARYAPAGVFEYPTLRILEIDPVSGTVISNTVSEVPHSPNYDIAFDGHRLFSIDNTNDLVHEFTIDGTLIETSPLGEPDGDGGFVTINDLGTTVVGDSIITVRGNFDRLQVTRFDPLTNEFLFVAPVSLQPPTGVGEVPIPLPTQFTSTVGTSADGNSLELFEFNGSRRLTVDLDTGSSVVDDFPGGYVYASASVGGKSYYAMPGNRIEVHDNSGNVVNNFSYGGNIRALGSGTHRDNVVSVVVSTGQTTGGVNHAASNVTATISGNAATSPAGQIVQVYLDLDNDGAVGIGEPQTSTDVSGNYTFDEILPGEYSVRQVPPVDQFVRAETDEVARLFTLSYVNPVSTITELDPLSGEAINSFVAPGPSTTSGMASQAGKIYVAKLDTLYEIDSDDGTTLRIVTIPYGRYHGMAILGSIAYMHDTDTGMLQRYDLASDQLLGAFNLNENELYYADNGGLAESADGSSLIITVGSDAFTLDPDTGLIVDDIGPYALYGPYTPGRSMAGAAGQWFEPANFSTATPNKTISVRDASGFLLRKLPIQIEGYIDAMAAETVLPSNHRVSVFGSETLANLDFLNLVPAGTVTGTQFVDANANGVFDQDELTLEGATVFADLNNNQHLDSGEPNSISAADGTYSLENVPLGYHTIRSVLPDGYEVGEFYTETSRLFIAMFGSQSGSLPEYVRLVQIDPIDGTVLSDVDTSAALSSFSSLDVSYDGSQLIVVDNSQDLIHELTLDGQVIRTMPLGDSDGDGGILPINHLGTAAIGDSLVGVSGDSNTMQVTRYNSVTGEFEFLKPVSLLPQDFDPTGDFAMPDSFRTSVGRGLDDHSIVLLEQNGLRQLTIDLNTGDADFSDAPNFNDNRGFEAIGNETFYANQNGRIEVFDSEGTFVRELSVPSGTFGIGAVSVAGGSFRDNGVAVLVSAQESLADINHASDDARSILSGTVSTLPAGEVVQVYLDLNNNKFFDANEPTAMTDVDGDYTIEDVLPGDYHVRQVVLPGQIVEAVTDDVARLFIQSRVDGFSTITELDPQSGEAINSFAGPGPNARSGMSTHEGRLFLARVDSLYEINADTGVIISTTSIPNGNYAGMAILDSIAYMHDSQNGMLHKYDLISKQLLSSINLSFQFPQYSSSPGGLSKSADGQTLLFSFGQTTFSLDPVTEHLQEVGNFGFAGAMAGAAGLWFEPRVVGSSSPNKKIALRDASNFLTRELPFEIEGFIDAMTAEAVTPSNHRVSVFGGDTFTQLDFKDFADTGTVSGIQFVDGNENGVMDNEESPLAGVVVFVDANGNDWPDASEIQTISGADGSYALNDVPYGTALIRTMPTSGYQATVINDSTDRLFATQRFSDSNSPTGYMLEIIEIDPQTGAVGSRTLTDVPITGAHSTAYDGRQLIIVDNNLDVLYQVGIDGTLIEETPLPGTNNPIHVYGPVVVGGTIYLMADGGDAPTSLYTFDSDTNAFSSPKPITKLISPTSSSGQYSLTLSESADGKSIIAFDQYNNVFTIDPATGRMTESREDFDLYAFEFASTSVGGETFVGGVGFGGFRVYGFDSSNATDPNWTFKRTIPIDPSNSYARQGLGGGEHNDSGIRVLVDAANPSASSEISFGYRSNLGSVSGTIVEDVDGDGVATNADLPRAAAIVYVDANRNGTFDTGERETLTDGSGQYTFNQLEPGDHDIRVVVGAGEKASANVSQTRLFTTFTSAPGDTMIREHDPITGQQLRSFPAPAPQVNRVGLAVNANALYYASPNTLWMLDSDTGEELGQVALPTINHSGAAFVGEHVFVLAPGNETIHKIDPITQTLVQTFDINVINAGHPDGSFDLYGFLSESFDGTQLLTHGNGQLLTIDPDTGIVTTAPKNSNDSPGGSSAAGERYLARNGYLDVMNQNQVPIRQVPMGYYSDSVAVATVPGTRHFVHVAHDTEASNADFLVRGGLVPSDITLSTSSINENIDTTAADILFAELSTADASVIDSHLYEIIDGDGVDDSDNDRFIIAGNELSLRQGETLDYEVRSKFQVRIRTTDSSGNSFARAMTLRVNDLVETQGVITNNDLSSSSRSRIQTIAVEFDGSVAVDSDAFTLTNRTTDQEFGYGFDPPTVANGKTIVLLELQGPELDNGSLADGNYELKIDATKVSSMTGAGLDSDRDGKEDVEEFFGRVEEDQFYRLYGDASGDRSVGLNDFAVFRSAFGSESGDLNFDESLDYNDDGSIGLNDFAGFRSSFGDGLDFDL